MAHFVRRRIDYASFLGVIVAVFGILGGLMIEKGQWQDVTRFTAMLIVLGGTLGAVLLSTSSEELLGALRRLRHVFFEDRPDDVRIIEGLLRFAVVARRAGILSIEKEAQQLDEPFLRKGLLLAVDGADTQEIRRMMELDLRLDQESTEADASVLEMAGGYAPTIGIIGAVLGLMQVMKHLDNVSELGRGIATAFVATVYGVGSANLFFLPAAAKIRGRARRLTRSRELMLEGILAIAEGLNPTLIRLKLESYCALPAAPRPVKQPAASVQAR